MKVTIGATRITSNFDKLSDDIRRQMTGLIKDTCEQIAQEYKAAITTGTRSGRKYGKHVASAPGEPPADLSHELVQSVVCEYPSEEQGIVKVGAWFSRLLEFGTKKRAARPAMRPITERTGPKYKKRAEEIVRASAKSSEVR
jgi:HK97 gp10 family phage protein